MMISGVKAARVAQQILTDVKNETIQNVHKWSIEGETEYGQKISVAK